MWVITSDHNIVNLDAYDDVTPLSPDTPDGLPRLGAPYQLVARRLVPGAGPNGAPGMTGAVLFEGPKDIVLQAASAVANGLRRGMRIVDLQLSALDIEADGHKPIVPEAEPVGGPGQAVSTEGAQSMGPIKTAPGSGPPSDTNPPIVDEGTAE